MQLKRLLNEKQSYSLRSKVQGKATTKTLPPSHRIGSKDKGMAATIHNEALKLLLECVTPQSAIGLSDY